MGSFARNLAIESWTLHAFGILLIICRMTSRRLQRGAFTCYQLDDWIMFFVTITFTAVIVTTHQLASNGGNYVPPGAAELLTPEEVISAVYGSKLTMALEEFTLTTIWLCKACMLILYGRLTMGLKRQLAVKILGWYCLIGFVVIQTLYLGYWCKPIQQYWLVPVRDQECATYQSHMIVTTIFNISSDLMILFIPLPLLVSSELPLKRKLILGGVFSLGIFVILAAILTRYFNFTEAFSPSFLNWYVSEVSAAVYVANIPLCWPLAQRMFALDAFSPSPSSFSSCQEVDDSASPSEEKSPDPSILNTTSSAAEHASSDSRSLKTCRGRTQRMSSSTAQEQESSTVGFSLNEEIGTACWAGSTGPEVPAEMCTVSRVAKFETCIAGGRDCREEEDGWWDTENILKTVEIEQYSSQS